MRISIITPTFNSGQTIASCVNSIINQSYQNFQHIIIDNLSSDRTVTIIEDIYRQSGMTEKIKIISEMDRGISDAFNKGIEAAEGDIIGILNSDDYYYNVYTLERIKEAFTDKNVLLVHGKILMRDPVYGSNVRKPLRCEVTRGMPYNHPTMYFHRTVYEKYGSYDLDFRIVMDYDLIMRLRKKAPEILKNSIYLSSDPLVVMNFGGNSWKFENASLKEIKSAFIKNDLWNYTARYHLVLRNIRLTLRNLMTTFRLNFIVRWWRQWKWRGRDIYES